MDQTNYVEGPFLRAEWLEKFKDGAADQLSSTAMHALEGCIAGLTPTAAQTHVTARRGIRQRQPAAAPRQPRYRPRRADPAHRQPGGLGDRARQLHH